MKKLITAVAMSVALIAGSVYASIPVKKAQIEQTSETLTSQDKVEKQEVKTMLKSLKKADKKTSAPTPKHDEEFWITLALWFFLGGFAAHRWYAGKPAGWNILFILTAGGCGIWALVDLINILKGKF